MRCVTIESPFGAPTPEGIATNVAYARACLLDSLRRGEAPLASHLLYPQALSDALPDERQKGMMAGYEWMKAAEAVVLYLDRGVSNGMKTAESYALQFQKPVERRWLGEWEAPATVQESPDEARE